MLLNPIYEYKKLSRDESTGKRLYACPDGTKVPSVTTVLDSTKDKTFLIEWRKRVGDAEATRISTESAGLGTSFVISDTRFATEVIDNYLHLWYIVRLHIQS